MKKLTGSVAMVTGESKGIGVLAKELERRQIRINLVNPRFTLTEGTGSYIGLDLEKCLVTQVGFCSPKFIEPYRSDNE